LKKPETEAKAEAKAKAKGKEAYRSAAEIPLCSEAISGRAENEEQRRKGHSKKWMWHV